MNIIECKNITKKYPKGTVALNDVSINIEQGSFVAVMGPSGSGKSTLMNIMGLLDKQTEGELILDGHKIENQTDKELSRMRMETIGFVFQSFLLNEHLTAKDNIILAMQLNENYSDNEMEKKQKCFWKR